MFEHSKEVVASATTESDKVKLAATMMIENPMDLIRQVLQRHEESVVTVMRELDVERRELRDALISLVAVARRYLPDYDEHPEVQKADEVLERVALSKREVG